MTCTQATTIPLSSVFSKPYLMREHHYRDTDHHATTMALNVTPSVSPTDPEPDTPAAAMDVNSPNGMGMGATANIKVPLAAAKAIPSAMINDCDNHGPIENLIVSLVRCGLSTQPKSIAPDP